MKIKKRLTAMCLTAALAFSMVQPALAWQTGDVTLRKLADEDLAPGIHYTEEDIHNYGDDLRRLRVNHLSIDPEAEGVEFRSARAENTINAREDILDQAMRDVYQGENVVASVNADPYDMDYGINCGIQVRDGAVVISQPNNSYTTNTLVFFIDGDGKAHIDPLRAMADITVKAAEGGEDYSKTVTTINRNMFGSWYSDESKFTTDTLRIYTSNITSDNTMTHYRTEGMPQNQAYALIELDDFDGAVKAGTEYTGTVREVYTTDGFDIPDNCIVLAGYAGDAAGVAALQKDQTVSLACHLYTGAYTEDANGFIDERGEECDDVETAVNGYHLLAKDGNVNQVMVDNSGTDVNSRTVIGLTADGKVEIVCVNKPGSNFSADLTTGTTFKEITQYMMEELGCVDVLNMDGGGSTEMTARRAGSDELKTVSYPSDGGSRIVSNSLLIVSNAKRTADVEQILIDGSKNIYIGSHTEFNVRMTDKSGNVISSDGQNAVWSAEKGVIDADGVYTAPETAGEDTVTATVKGKSGKVKISVVDGSGIASIGLNASGTVALAKDAKNQFGFNAYDADQQEIVIDPSLAKWSMTGDEIGTLGDDGLLTVTAESGEAEVTAEFLDRTYKVPVVVGLKEQMIDDFEGDQAAYHISSRYIYPDHPSYYAGDGNDMVGITNDKAKVKNGNGSLYWIYDTNKWPRTTNGTMNFFPDWDVPAVDRGWTQEEQTKLLSQYRAKAKPEKFGLWIYSGDENNDGISDNYNCMSTAYFKVNDGTYVDENGKTHYVAADGNGTPGSRNIKITPTEHMDWIGWKYFEFDVPDDWQMPITFNYMMMSNIYKGADQANYRTTVMLDDLKWIYTDEEQDNDGPVFSETTPDGTGLFKTELDFSTIVTDASGVKAETISATVNGEPVEYNYDAATGKITFKKPDLKDGESYRVAVKAQDNRGNESTSYVDKTYTVDLSNDEEGPVISNVTPESGSKLPVQVPSPRIGFKIKDAKSGIDVSSIKVTLDGKAVSDVYCDEATGWCYAQPDFKLADGTSSAEIAIDANDKNGNKMDTYKDTVSVSLIAQPKDADNYSISVIPDTQGNAYSSMIFPRAAASDSELVIHLGDIVDGVNTAEFDEGKKWADGMNKPYLVAAGNHEGGNLDLDMYNEYFGSPTYYFDYGKTRIIMLNSAFTQSISATDPTQYRFLENALESNTLPNVYVVSHVVPEDHFNTQHNMTTEECAKLEDMLGAYKKAHPAVNITEISGHLHTLEGYERQGVQYIIGGNAAGKGYVTNDEGNILGTGKITVKEGKASYSFDPLLTKIYIRNAAMQNGTLKLAKGGTAQLDVYGDFREKARTDSYMTNISDDELVDINWSSSDTSVAEVSDDGIVTVKGDGSANITAVSGGKSNTVNIESVDVSTATLRSISVSVPESTRAGDIFVPSVKGEDVYGNVIALNNSDVTFKDESGLLVINNDGTITASSAGKGSIEASYKGLTAKAEYTIERRHSSGGGSGSTITYYTIEKNASENGSLSLSHEKASSGTDVTITAAPDNGYKVKSVTANDGNGRSVSVSNIGNGKYKFTMPTGNVKVSAVFEKSDNTAPAAGKFKDVPAGYWGTDAINWADSNGYMTGKTADKFDPNGNITREQMWMIMARMSGKSPADMSEAREWAMANKISDGTGHEKAMSRQQMVTMLYRYASLNGRDVTGSADIASFSDDQNVDAYALDAVKWAVSEKLINGVGGNTIAPDGTASRAQFATILQRFMSQKAA